jgi:hypothetical protein
VRARSVYACMCTSRTQPPPPPLTQRLLKRLMINATASPDPGSSNFAVSSVMLSNLSDVSVSLTTGAWWAVFVRTLCERLHSHASPTGVSLTTNFTVLGDVPAFAVTVTQSDGTPLAEVSVEPVGGGEVCVLRASFYLYKTYDRILCHTLVFSVEQLGVDHA